MKGNSSEQVGYKLGQRLQALPAIVRRGILLAGIILLLAGIRYSSVLQLLLIPLVGWLVWYVFIRVDISDWLRDYPSLENYWTLNPETKSQSGTRCYFCKASRIESYAWKDHKELRVHYCHQCRNPLYRTYDKR